MKSHLLWVASYHAGNGWYLEQSYNYYTISLFVVYGTIWNRAFGDQHYPEIAAVLEKSFEELMKTYANFFGREWLHQHVGAQHLLPALDFRRFSGVVHAQVRTAAGCRVGPDGFVPDRFCNSRPGRTSTRTTFRPSGFYGHREFAIQNYSCPASPFIMFLPFIALALPEDSPFWTAKENDGFWDSAGKEFQTHRAGKTGPGPGQPRQQRHFGNHLRQGL